MATPSEMPIWRLVDAKQDEFNALSDRVWEIPELCYGEIKSCAEHTAMLEQQGFKVVTLPFDCGETSAVRLPDRSEW